MIDMDCCRFSYKDTHRFSPLIEAYLEGQDELKPFYAHSLNLKGIENAIQHRKSFPNHRKTLVKALRNQYHNQPQPNNFDGLLKRLENSNTFTVTTAHQTNLLLGPVYLIYKVMHAIVLAEDLKKQFPDYDFLPIYYAGSEDDDWEELDHFYYQEHKFQWKTDQTGAFGSAKIDEHLIQLIELWKKEAAANNSPYLKELFEMIDDSYQLGRTITEANRHLIHLVFKDTPLLVIDGNDADLKGLYREVMEDDIINHTAQQLVINTSNQLNEHYKTQAHPRAINLFYIKDGLRERIEKEGEQYYVVDTGITWTQEDLLETLKQYPERFSPNVILRPIFQEVILPNVAFIGGGSEVGYWMQLIEVFKHYKVPFPLLVLRQSVEFIEQSLINDWEVKNLPLEAIFDSTNNLWKEEALKHLPEDLQLIKEKNQINQALASLEQPIETLEATLSYSLEAVKKKINYQLEILEKKIIRAQKSKVENYKNEISDLQDRAFPYSGGLSERKEAFFIYYEKDGQNWMNFLKNNTDSMGKSFLLGIYKNN